jgi:hypothetical protein
MRIPALVPLLLAITFVAPARANAAEGVTPANFKIRVHEHAIGTENLEIEDTGDSLRVRSQTTQILNRSGTDSLFKQLRMVFTPDLDLRSYQSRQSLRGHVVLRGWTPGDTTFNVFRQIEGQGSGDSYSRPPGRLFIFDVGIYATFEMISRMIGGHGFLTRPLNVLVLGSPDSLYVMQLRDNGTETIPWGGKPVVTRRASVGDGSQRYLMWMAPDGRLLRLENESSGLRVDRVPPPVKRRTPAPKSAAS